MTDPSKLQSSYLPTLDGWRAIAIIAVMIYHGTLRLVQFNAHLADWANRGRHGVSIFFALSGLLICSRLIDEQRKNGFISLKNFYIRRCFRILPPYCAYLIVILALSCIGLVVPSRWEWLSVLFFWRNYLPAQLASGDSGFLSHFWSLSVEEQFYLVWPTLLVLFGLRRTRWLGLLIALPIAIWRGITPPDSYIFWHDPHWDKLLFGAVLAIWLWQGTNREWLTKWMKPWVFALLVIVALAAVSRKLPWSELWLSMLFPLLVTATMLHPAWWISRALENSAVRWIGRLSYSLYVWQELFLSTQAPRFLLQRFPYNFIATITCAGLSYYAIERPLLAVGQRIASASSRSKKKAVAAESRTLATRAAASMAAGES